MDQGIPDLPGGIWLATMRDAASGKRILPTQQSIGPDYALHSSDSSL